MANTYKYDRIKSIIHNVDDTVSISSSLADIPQEDNGLKTLSYEGRGEKHTVG